MRGKFWALPTAFSGDGPAECGPYPRLWENKVLGAKGWNKLERDGLKSIPGLLRPSAALYGLF